MAWGRRVRIFWKFFSGRSSWAVGLFWGAWASCSALVWQSWLTIVSNALGWVSKLTRSEGCAQVAIFSVCYKWRICSVWQVAWERMNGCSYVIERTMQSSPLLREGGLRNDAARAALWRTRPYECAIDVCQLLTIVIAGVCRVEFSSLTFATNSGFVRFNKLWCVLAVANFYEWYAYQNWHERCPMTITRYGLVENQQLVIACDYRERVFIFNVCNNWRICSVCYLCRN